MLLQTLLSALLSAPAIFAYTGDVPLINGPIPTVPFSDGMKTRPSDFQHPGLWHTHDQLETIRDGVMSNSEPWASAFAEFSADPLSFSNYTIQGPKQVLSRGAVSNYTSFAKDARAAYHNALMWYITQDSAHLNTSANILNTWGNNLTNVIGVDRSLFVGLDGDIFVNAAEIIRWEAPGATQFNPSQIGAGFNAQFYWLFSRQSIDIGQANYGFASIKAMLNFAVYLDDVQMYNYALYAYQNDYCAGLPSLFDISTGQGSEAGRDQGHAQDAVGWSFLATRTLANQGLDLYGQNDNVLFKAAEYTATYNTNQTVAYDPSWYRCEAILVGGPWPEISNKSRGVTPNRPMWDIVYYKAQELGIDTPNVALAKQQVDLMGGERTPNVSINDFPSWGDLLWGFNATTGNSSSTGDSIGNADTNSIDGSGKGNGKSNGKGHGNGKW